MKESLNKKVYLRKASYITSDLGDTNISWLSPTPFDLSFQPASGQMLFEAYGTRVNYMLVSYVPVDSKISEGDGFCINVNRDKAPDYLVVAVYKYSRHHKILIEKVVTSGGHK